MDKQQAETAAEALIAPHRVSQASIQQQQERASKLRAQRYRGAGALIGFTVGAIGGFVVFDGIWPTAIVACAVGAIAGMFVYERARKRSGN